MSLSHSFDMLLRVVKAVFDDRRCKHVYTLQPSYPERKTMMSALATSLPSLRFHGASMFKVGTKVARSP